MAEYDRPYRARRSRGREQAAPDTATAALTAQVILCVLLIVCLLLVKKFDGAGFARVKSQYDEMRTDTGSSGRLVAWATEPEGLFGRIYSAITGRSTAREEDETYDEPTPELEEGYNSDEAAGSYLTEEAVPADEIQQLDEDAPPVTEGYNPANGVADPGYEYISKASDESGVPALAHAKIMPPVTGLITSGFSARESPVTGDDEFHSGLDIAAEEGREIHAALPGEVSEVGVSRIYGNYIILKHATNLETFYAHCSEIVAEEGDAVDQGQCIAKVGSTGVTTGPHLHFGVIIEGEFFDPEPILSDYIRQAS